MSDHEIKSILTQQEVGCNNRGVWIEKVQEYDIEIKPTKLVRGNALCKALVEDQQSKEEDTPKVFMVSLQDPWFSNITYFLTYGECPNGLAIKKRRDLKIKALKYVIHDDVLYKREIENFETILLLALYV